jgi:hypothetical protein
VHANSVHFIVWCVREREGRALLEVVADNSKSVRGERHMRAGG